MKFIITKEQIDKLVALIGPVPTSIGLPIVQLLQDVMRAPATPDDKTPPTT